MSCSEATLPYRIIRHLRICMVTIYDVYKLLYSTMQIGYGTFLKNIAQTNYLS
jgi:hypothetical protein